MSSGVVNVVVSFDVNTERLEIFKLHHSDIIGSLFSIVVPYFSAVTYILFSILFFLETFIKMDNAVGYAVPISGCFHHHDGCVIAMTQASFSAPRLNFYLLSAVYGCTVLLMRTILKSSTNTPTVSEKQYLDQCYLKKFSVTSCFTYLNWSAASLQLWWFHNY